MSHTKVWGRRKGRRNKRLELHIFLYKLQNNYFRLACFWHIHIVTSNVLTQVENFFQKLRTLRNNGVSIDIYTVVPVRKLNQFHHCLKFVVTSINFSPSPSSNACNVALTVIRYLCRCKQTVEVR